MADQVLERFWDKVKAQLKRNERCCKTCANMRAKEKRKQKKLFKMITGEKQGE